ncbi:hypothetical protein [Rubrivivax sp. A210]|uniref:hypothetical protein n=1 Tax=Rubrivivax sp. A210 TaxID=2772301 RepID=UPI0019180B98|nr:hypothetical protein [Rubrivivax sp. A210]
MPVQDAAPPPASAAEPPKPAETYLEACTRQSAGGIGKTTRIYVCMKRKCCGTNVAREPSCLAYHQSSAGLPCLPHD